MKSVEAQGYNKTAALESTGLDVTLDRLKNATQSWKKAGSPMENKKLSAFMADYIKDKKAVGAYIVVDSASDDTRLRPYTIINETTVGKRKSTTTYQIKEADFTVKYHPATKTVVNKETGEEKVIEYQTPYRKEIMNFEVKNEDGSIETKTKEVEIPDVKVTSKGAVEATSTKKDEAFKLVKELVEANHKPYVIEIVKEITDGQKYAGYALYTPSASAKQGKFMFFVAD